jgi:hypothetical protein
MPTLNEIIGGNANPITTVFTTNNIAIEPLDGPTSVEDVMDRFPEEVYQQGRDTHLYRLLSALCGDAGAGLAKKQAYAARLRYEAEFVNFKVLDEIYVSQFQFQRLRDETYRFNVNVDALSATQWNQVEKAEQKYYHRIAKWWTATRHGNSPEGIRLAAEAGTGLECDVYEHYRFIYDQFSDLQLGLKPEGFTLSTSEFTIIPRFVPDQDISFETPYEKIWTFDPPNLTNARPAPAPTNPNDLTVVQTYIPPPAARVELVGEASTVGSTIAIPPHIPGDLIILTASLHGKQTNIPTAGGTVPAWISEFADSSNNLFVTVASFIATSNNHTSGTWFNGHAGLLSVTVWRGFNTTEVKIGNKSKHVRFSAGEPQQPFVWYPALDVIEDGTSTVYRICVQAETADSQIDTPPPSYKLIHKLNARWASPALAVHYREHVLDDPILDKVRSTNSNGPSGSVNYSIEIQAVPRAGITIETKAQRLNRYALEQTQLVVKEPFNRLLPEIERNAHEMLDRIKPATTIATIKPEPNKYQKIELLSTPAASSERINVVRFVTGSGSVLWPPLDPERNHFIQSGVENEPGYYYGMNRDLPIIFLTPESIHAYSGEALNDPNYGTDDFFDASSGVAPFEFYRSEHQGSFFPVIGAIFPFVLTITPDISFNALNALAAQDTLLIMEGAPL